MCAGVVCVCLCGVCVPGVRAASPRDVLVLLLGEGFGETVGVLPWEKRAALAGGRARSILLRAGRL